MQEYFKNSKNERSLYSRNIKNDNTWHAYNIEIAKMIRI